MFSETKLTYEKPSISTSAREETSRQYDSYDTSQLFTPPKSIDTMKTSTTPEARHIFSDVTVVCSNHSSVSLTGQLVVQ